ncbi:MAG: DUF11 domain-containing protein [Propionibacteriaceae bacterium]|jgi:uncharacterized repeat protein (TIGR01451 family)|nr:DUF11 domain-containing protein [Propionibacteriaceae bacterium]
MSIPTASPVLPRPGRPRRSASAGRRWTVRLVVSALAAFGLASPLVSQTEEAAAIPPFPIDALGKPASGEGVVGWTLVASGGSTSSGKWTSDGWLRLTANEKSLKTAITNDTPFPSGTGFEVSFDYRIANGSYTDGNRTGDGLAFFIINDFDPRYNKETAATSGAAGAGLGYAGSNTMSAPGKCGIRMGYLGLGLDARGNYASTTMGLKESGGDDSLSAGSLIGLRGPGLGPLIPDTGGNCPISVADAGITKSPNYPWIKGVNTDIVTGSDAGVDPAGQTASSYRRVLIRVVPNGSAVNVTVFRGPVKVKSTATTRGEMTQVFTADMAASYYGMTLPEKMRIGFSASTGVATNYQDIRNVQVVSVGDLAAGAALHASTPGDPAASFNPGQPVSFALTATNNGPTIVGDSTPAAYPGNLGYARLASDLSALPLTGVKWTCTGVGGAVCLTPSGSGPLVKADWTGPKGSYITVKVDAVVGAGNGVYAVKAVVPTDFTNNVVDPTVAAVQADHGLNDTNLSNNTASVNFTITRPALELAKTVSPSASASFILGQQLTYTFTVKNNSTGAMAGVTVEETAFTGTGTLSALAYAWPDPNQPGVLASGATVTATARYTITEGDVANGRIDNTAIAKGQLVSTSAQVVSSPASAAIKAASKFGLALAKTADATQLHSPPQPGDIISYTLACRNDSSNGVRDIEIKDSRPNVSPLVLTWPDPNNKNWLNSGQSLIATTAYAITQADIDNGSVANTAKCTATATDDDGKDLSLEAWGQATVQLAVAQPVLLNVRQVVIRPNGSLAAVPVTGYAALAVGSQTAGLVMASGEKGGDVPYTAYAIAPPVETSYDLRVINPQLYSYVGFIVTATAEGQAGEDINTGLPSFQYENGAVALWVTVYIELDGGAALPDYDWSSWTNDFGHIKAV